MVNRMLSLVVTAILVLPASLVVFFRRSGARSRQLENFNFARAKAQER